MKTIYTILFENTYDYMNNNNSVRSFEKLDDARKYLNERMEYEIKDGEYDKNLVIVTKDSFTIYSDNTKTNWKFRGEIIKSILFSNYY